MLTKIHRPKSFREMKGARLAKEVLMAMAKNPANSPRSLIVHGGYGLGKTTAARIFAKAVNCEGHTGDACNQCKSCKEIAEGSPLYQEFDSAIVGNVEKMREVRELFSYSVTQGYRVIVFDESHLTSPQAQSALLKVLEEAPKNIFYVFPTTDADKILDTIKSRSLILEIPTMTPAEIKSMITDIAKLEEIGVTDTVTERIARRSRGHARDAIQQLEMVKLVGTDSYLEIASVLDEQFAALFKFYMEENAASIKATVDAILNNPVHHVRQDFDVFMKNMADQIYVSDAKLPKGCKESIHYYLRYQKYLNSSSDWHLFLMSLSAIFKKQQMGEAASRFQKRPVNEP